MSDAPSPGGLIGRALPRGAAQRLAAGRGRYVDDLAPPGLLHVVFVRSPYAHARVKSIDAVEARACPGVFAVVTGADMARVCAPWRPVLANVPGMQAPLQHALAPEEVSWQGEAVAAVVARSRAEAEDAAEHVSVDWEELPAVADPESALESGAPVVNASIGSNLCATLDFANGEVEAGFAAAAVVVSHRFEFGRVTGVPLEPRGLVADFDPGEGRLTVHQSHQTPWQMQDLLARQLGLPEGKVRVIAPDVGGAFGVKLHTYADEMATAALALMLKRPVKFVADRIESFLTDAHAREAIVEARLGVDAAGGVTALSLEVTSGLGAYSMFPRSSLGEGLQAAQMAGAAYRVPAFRASLRAAYQNKVPTGAVRAVGQPLATVVTEQMLDFAARASGIDPVELRRRNHVREPDLPGRSPGGVALQSLSLDACLETLLNRMDYTRLRREQAEARAQGRLRGIGVANFLELTAVGSGLYGPAGVSVSAHESCTLRLEPGGGLRCQVSATDQGQGTPAGIAQVIAHEFGVPPDAVAVDAGDAGIAQYGGGAWGSRGMAIGGEAALRAARELRARVLALAAHLVGGVPSDLALAGGRIVDAGGTPRIDLAEVARAAHFRQHTLPPALDPNLVVSAAFVPQAHPYYTANGVQACHLELDAETGAIRLLGFWVVEDCGRVVNPQLVDSQIRGGVVQGIGGALYEHCRYDAAGQLLNGSLADYALPLASEMPDIDIAHVETPATETLLGAKGVGEAGTVGASAAIWCAVNDALAPLGARVWRQPFTPAHVLEAIGDSNR